MKKKKIACTFYKSAMMNKKSAQLVSIFTLKNCVNLKIILKKKAIFKGDIDS